MRTLDRDLLTSEFVKMGEERERELSIDARLRSVLWDLVEYPETSKVGF